MKTLPQSIGWNGTFVQVGTVARVHAKGFGRHCIAEVIAMDDVGTCDVSIRRIGGSPAGWEPGDQTMIHAAWLEGTK